MGEPKQFICLFSHGRDHEHDLVTASTAARNMISHVSDPSWIGHGGSAELLY
jgi:hypothetical protein